MPSARVVAASENGTAWAFKGLCEFRLKNYDTALSDLTEARTRGVVGSRDVPTSPAITPRSCSPASAQFEQALRILSDFGLEGNDSPGIIEAMGLAMLRMPMLPDDLPGTSPSWS